MGFEKVRSEKNFFLPRVPEMKSVKNNGMVNSKYVQCITNQWRVQDRFLGGGAIRPFGSPRCLLGPRNRRHEVQSEIWHSHTTLNTNIVRHIAFINFTFDATLYREKYVQRKAWDDRSPSGHATVTDCDMGKRLPFAMSSEAT